MKITVRRAIEGDIPWMLDELKKFSDFFGTRIPLFDPNTAKGTLSQILENHVVFVAVREQEALGTGVSVFLPIGFIAGAQVSHPLNPAIRVFAELLWWVQEEFRGSRAGAMLLEQFTAYGREHADWITMTLEAKSPVNPAVLERKGFRHQESSFVMEVA